MRHEEIFKQAQKSFNSGDYFEAHELLEDIWQDIRLNDPENPELNSLQALIQLAVSLHLLTQNRIIGAQKVLERARKNMQKSSSVYNSVDLELLYQKIIRFFDNSDPFDMANVKI